MWGQFFKIGRKGRPPPGKEAYKPKFVRGEDAGEEVSERLRAVRLRRRTGRASRMQRTPVLIHIAIGLAIVGFLLALLSVLRL